MKQRECPAGGWITLVDYQRIIEKYLPHVLTECTKYTTSKQVARTIAVYVFVCVYYMAEKLDSPSRIPLAIETMIEVIGSDLSDGTGREDSKSPGDLEQLKGIVETVMEYLIKLN
jgi:hypothetical protein